MHTPSHTAFVVAAALFAAVTAAAMTAEFDTARFIEDSCITYEKRIEFETTPDVWDRMLDMPDFVGRLWNLYGFDPAYRVSVEGARIRLTDPTGIEAFLTPLVDRSGARHYTVRGSIKRRPMPFAVTGNALFMLDYAHEAGKLHVTMRIYGEGGSLIENLAIRTVSPLLLHFAEKRVSRNVRDISVIIADIMHDTDALARRLDARDRRILDRFRDTTMRGDAGGPVPSRLTRDDAARQAGLAASLP